MTRRWNLLAWGILASVFLGMSVYLILNPTRTGVVPNYRFATAEWWWGRSMYPGGTHKFLYAPSFAVVFSLLSFLKPLILGEIVWRAFGFGLFGWGLWRLAKINFSAKGFENQASDFLWMVLLAVPASLASLNNGQTNLSLSACLIWAAGAIRKGKWNWLAFWLNLALLMKPLALAPWLLAFTVLGPTRIPLLVGVTIMFGIGLMNPDFAYATGQWAEFLQKLLVSYSPVNLRVSDLFGAVERAEVILSPFLIKGIRAAACLGALAYMWHSLRRQGVAGAAWALWVGSALVFTLFNPRAETNSYVLISPLLAYAAVNYWREKDGGRWKGWILAVACIGLMCDGMGLWIYKATDVWFKPLVVLLVSPLLFRVPIPWKGGSGRRED